MANATTNPNRKSFYLILVIFPLLVLALIEGTLRISGFGNSYPLFIDAKGLDGYLQPNPELIKRYFTNPEFAPSISPDTTYFKKDKSSDTFRIVVQGGSSAAGFPYGRFGSLSGMLAQRFKRLYPDKNIEIINTAMSAVNSYTLLDLTDEIIDIQPDLVLIYAGHNEYLGIMGVGSILGSVSNRPSKLLFLKLKELRLLQLMQSVLSLFTEKPDISSSTDRTLMATVATGQEIVFESDGYHMGVEQFSKNLDLILSDYKEASIPVILGNLVSNEKDQVPFASTEGQNNASMTFERAELLRQKGDYSTARKEYQRARDKDLLRFRAPTHFNQIIQEKVAEYDVFLADVESLIRKDTKDGIIGKQHMLEHLHPNARGYFLLSEAYLETITNNNLLAESPVNISKRKALQDIPLTSVDMIIAQNKIAQLTSGYPFKQAVRPELDFDVNAYDRQIAERRLSGEDWVTSMQSMLRGYQKAQRYKEAAKVAGLMFDALPDQHQVAYIAGQLYSQIDDMAIARYYHKKATSLAPDNVNYLLMSARSHYMSQMLDESIRLLERAVILAPDNQQALFQLNRIKKEKSYGN